MKIGVYLINIHHTFLNDFIRILNPEKNEVHLFVSEKIYKLLIELSPDINGTTIPYIYNGKGIIAYNKEITKQSKNLDCIVISPNSGRKGIFSHLFLRPKCPYLFIDVLFGDVFLNFYGFFKWDSVSNFIYKWIYKRMMHKSAGLIYSSVPIMNMITYYIKKPTIFFPFNFFHSETYLESNSIPRTGKTVFTITGTLEQRRKDMSCLFEALDLLLKDTDFNKDQFQIVILGGLLSDKNQFGKDCISKAKKYNIFFGKEVIITFDTIFIDEPVYRKWISVTDVILNAINMEQYKYGKFCSGMSESISYCLPGIYPTEYRILDELSSSSLKFSSGYELAELIKLLTNNKNYLEELSVNALNNSQSFSIVNYRKKIFSFIEETCLSNK